MGFRANKHLYIKKGMGGVKGVIKGVSAGNSMLPPTKRGQPSPKPNFENQKKISIHPRLTTGARVHTQGKLSSHDNHLW